MINRDELAAFARAIVTLAVGSIPFVAIGHWVSWPLAIGVLVVSAIAAAVWARYHLLGRMW